MRPSTQLLLRALLALGAITAVTSCKKGIITDPPPAPPPPPPPPAPQPVVFVGAADIATCSSPATAATAAAIDTIPGTVFTAGDNLADSSGNYQDCFGPYWGRHKDRLYATLGNRDYDPGSADPAFDYFGERAGPRGLGYYSFDLGKWHVVVLNTSGFVDMSATSPQLQWLRADLAALAQNGSSANKPQCTLALFHKRRFYQGSWGKNETIKPIWDALYAAGVEFVVNGQDKFYERYTPLTPDGVQDPAKGIRQFIVGTGGRWLDQLIAPSPNVEVRNNTTWGVMKFTLNAGSYSWKFVPAAGGTFTDSGTGTCH